VGDEYYGFDDHNEDPLNKWEEILRNDEILGICRQLGVADEYFRKLFGNSFEEIGDYEILKYVSQESRKRPINFQTLEGIGGMKWSYKAFFSIDIDKLATEAKVIKECLALRHRIIHGEVDDSAITREAVLEFEDAVRKIISYLRDEIMTWGHVVDSGYPLPSIFERFRGEP